jgi:hypothetical protein
MGIGYSLSIWGGRSSVSAFEEGESHLLPKFTHEESFYMQLKSNTRVHGGEAADAQPDLVYTTV